MRDERTIVVLEGDETGQELLEESLRVLAPDVIGVELELPRFDLRPRLHVVRVHPPQRPHAGEPQRIQQSAAGVAAVDRG